MTFTMGAEHFDLRDKLTDVLDGEPDPVKQQITIELLVATHAARMGNGRAARFVIESMMKHALQILRSGE